MQDHEGGYEGPFPSDPEHQQPVELTQEQMDRHREITEVRLERDKSSAEKPNARVKEPEKWEGIRNEFIDRFTEMTGIPREDTLHYMETKAKLAESHEALRGYQGDRNSEEYIRQDTAYREEYHALGQLAKKEDEAIMVSVQGYKPSTSSPEASRST